MKRKFVVNAIIEVIDDGEDDGFDDAMVCDLIGDKMQSCRDMIAGSLKRQVEIRNFSRKIGARTYREPAVNLIGLEVAFKK
jgi:hypothetical protein